MKRFSVQKEYIYAGSKMQPGFFCWGCFQYFSDGPCTALRWGEIPQKVQFSQLRPPPSWILITDLLHYTYMKEYTLSPENKLIFVIVNQYYNRNNPV